MGMVEAEETFGYDFIIYCDNGDTLYPAVNALPNFDTYYKQRVLTNYTILDEVGLSEHAYYVKINNLYDVLLKDIILQNNANNDSLGNNPVVIKDIWLVKNMLNIEFQYQGGSAIHFINLSYRTNENGKIEEPVELEFRHNNNNDENSYLMDGMVTFQLDKLRKEDKNTIDFIVNSSDLNNENHTYTGTYSY